jgi:outer membrane receptor protein involved in Fe transport
VDNAGLPADQYPVGEPLPAVPSVTGNAFVDVAVSPALSATFRGMVVGRQVVFSERFAGQRTRLDPYALLGMTLRWQTSSHAQFHLRVENLLNTQYAAAVDRPGLPLTAVLGARLTS